MEHAAAHLVNLGEANSERRIGTGCFAVERLFATRHSPFAIRHSPFAHPGTRRFSPAARGRARGATGTRAPRGDPGAGFPPAPADPVGPAREPVWGSLGPGEGSPGLPCGTRVAAISVPVRSSACRSAPLLELRGCHLASWRPTISRHCWRFLVSGFPGPPGSRPSARPTFQAPIAATLGAGTERPVGSSDGGIMRPVQVGGDSDAVGRTRRHP